MASESSELSDDSVDNIVTDFLQSVRTLHDSTTSEYSDNGTDELNSDLSLDMSEDSDVNANDRITYTHNVTNAQTDENRDNAISALTNRYLIHVFVDKLLECDLIADFVTLVTEIANGKLDPMNVPFICSLERAKFNALTTTTNMTFSDITKRFWLTVLKVGHGKILHLMAGRKSAGNVVNEIEKKGLFNPDKSTVNFVVPSRQCLKKFMKAVPKDVKPGMIDVSFEMLDRNKEFVLHFDGKKIASGLAGDDVGDINLMGLEGPPNLCQQKSQYRGDIECCENALIESNEDPVSTFDSTRDVLLRMSNRYKQVQNRLAETSLRLKKVESYPSFPKDRFMFAKANLKCEIHLLNLWKHKSESILNDIGRVLSKCQKNEDSYQMDDKVPLVSQSNVRLLHNPTQLIPRISTLIVPSQVKQRSTKWHDIRNSVNVTGSTVWNGLGLRTQRDQRKHFKRFIDKNTSLQIHHKILTRMQHGIDNEVHGIATCVSCFMPMLLPECYVFVEQGIHILPGKQVNSLMGISPDGLLQCRYQLDGEFCPIQHELHDKIVVEIKCPFPREGCVGVHYEIPTYYSLQLLSEMYVTNSASAWYITYSSETSSLIELKFDHKVWMEVWKFIVLMFDHAQPVIDPTITNECKSLKNILRRYIDENSTFICEMPSRKSTLDTCDCSNASSIYHKSSVSARSLYMPYVIPDGIYDICKELFIEAFQMLRNKAQEIFACVISDTDRISEPTLPPYLPLAYGLKGYSMPLSVLRGFVEVVRRKCFEKKVHVLCETYDGQWHGIVMKTKEGKPLTRLQLSKKIWLSNIKKSKKELISTLTSFSVIKPECLQNWSSMCWYTSGCVSIDNIKVSFERKANSTGRCLNLSCTAVDNDGENLYEQIVTPSPRTSPRLWIDKSRKSRRSHTSISEKMSISDIIHMLPREIWSSSEDDEVNDESLDQSLQASSGSESTCGSDGEVQHLHQHDLLQEILRQLRRTKFQIKWQDVTPKDLYCTYLSSTQVIGNFFTVQELDVIRSVVLEVTGKNLFPKSASKSIKVNKIGYLFGDTEEWSSNLSRKRSPDKLQNLVTKVLMDSSYPKNVLAGLQSQLNYKTQEKEWEDNFKHSLYVKVRGQQAPFQLFAYPEFSDERQQYEARVLDVHHLYNNLRSQICKNGISFVPKSVVQKLQDHASKSISSLIISHVLDQQCCEITQRFFSEEVELELIKLGELEAANFFHCARGWFEACDKRGLKPLDRINRLIRFHELLTRDIEWSEFPPPGKYVKGIPLVTFEGILQNISMRILLYKFSRFGTFCHRAICTVPVESFFGEVSEVCYSGSSCPKATQMSGLLSHMQIINWIRHDPNKKFDMSYKRKAAYPTQLLMKELEVQKKHEDPLFRTHFFDVQLSKPMRKKNKRKRTEYGDRNTQKTGVKGHRASYFSVDVSKFNDAELLGIKLQ